MAHWYSVYHKEDYEAEIQVGPHDQWLQQLEFGPTQADRVLVHTDMMEHAHERRFAVCEMGMDMSYFTTEHPHRIQRAIDHLQSHFVANATREVNDADNHQDAALIGLARSPSGVLQHDCSQFTAVQNQPKVVPMQTVLQTMLLQPDPADCAKGFDVAEDLIMDDASGTDDNDDLEKRLYLELLKKARKRTSRCSSEAVRQLKLARYRRHPMRSGVKDVKKDLRAGCSRSG